MISLLIRKIVIYGIIIIIFILVVSLYGFFSSVKHPKIMVDYKPEDFDLDYEDAIFESTDGLKLSGWFIPTGKIFPPVWRHALWLGSLPE